MPWPTFWMEPTGRCRLALRRYHSPPGDNAWTCEAGWHEAVYWTGEEVDEVLTDRGTRTQPAPTPPPDDPRWPTYCEKGCGYQFAAEDRWQLWSAALYRRTDTGELRVLHPNLTPPDVPTAEPGAMWDASTWRAYCVGPDGIALIVRCPRPDGSAGSAHDWCVDDTARDGGRWQRTGDPKACNITASPSIAIGQPGTPGYYHGFLANGVLTDHIG